MSDELLSPERFREIEREFELYEFGPLVSEGKDLCCAYRVLRSRLERAEEERKRWMQAALDLSYAVESKDPENIRAKARLVDALLGLRQREVP